ncbi:MAG TPA: nuclear transport factor 2 family protein [Vicinamibacterales bacterium]|jgi:hypothetical protein|nr:nuclear transport factor 2 family protein [Vicinamibacterales bacterium]
MKKSLTAFSLLLTMVGFTPVVALAQSSTASDSDVIATITKMEHDAVTADLSGDHAFYQNYLANDWSGGSSRGTRDSKPSIIAAMKDTQNNKTTSESIGDVKVRVYGDVAIAEYQSTYDAMIRGKRYARTIITTDTFLQQDGAWKQIASHSSQVAK